MDSNTLDALITHARRIATPAALPGHPPPVAGAVRVKLVRRNYVSGTIAVDAGLIVLTGKGGDVP